MILVDESNTTDHDNSWCPRPVTSAPVVLPYHTWLWSTSVATTNPNIETIQNIDTYMHSPGSLQYPLVSLHPGAHTAET